MQQMQFLKYRDIFNKNNHWNSLQIGCALSICSYQDKLLFLEDTLLVKLKL